MKECEKIIKNIVLFIEGKLSKEEMVRFEKHFDLCASCKFYCEYLKTFFTNIEDSKNENYWEYLTQKIMKRIGDYGKEKILNRIRVKKFAVGFLFTMCVFLFILNEFQHQINIVRFYHLFKDFHILKNFDVIEEISLWEEESGQ